MTIVKLTDEEFARRFPAQRDALRTIVADTWQGDADPPASLEVELQEETGRLSAVLEEPGGPVTLWWGADTGGEWLEF